MQEYWQYIEDQTDFIEQQNESTLYCCDAPNGFEYRSFSTQILPSDEILKDHYNEWIRYLVPMNEELQTIKIWIGSKGVVTKFHFDASNNFNVEIRGQKLFRLSSVHPVSIGICIIFRGSIRSPGKRSWSKMDCLDINFRSMIGRKCHCLMEW